MKYIVWIYSKGIFEKKKKQKKNKKKNKNKTTTQYIHITGLQWK